MPAPVVEVTQLVAQNQIRTSRFERVAVLLGVSTFLAILLVAFLLWLADFQVDSTITKVTGYGLAVAFLVWFKLTKPTSRLTPLERAIRARRRIAALLGLLCSISVLGSILVAFSLHTWEDWFRLFLTATSPIGFGLLINTRFEMGSK